jgi:hypothetical protein
MVPADSRPAAAAQSPTSPICESILEPLVIGISGPRRGTSLASVVSTACNVVPSVTNTRKRMEGRRAVAVAHTREVVYWHDNASKGYKVLARCIDRGPSDTPAQAFGSWVWEVGFFAFHHDDAPAPLAREHESFRADVTRFKLRHQGVLAAQQLALFRHLLCESFRALDQNAIIVGGQQHWEQSWWPNPVVDEH